MPREQLRAKIPLAYDPYFAALDMQANPLVAGGVTLQEYRAQREDRLKFVAELETDAPASAMKAYFFIAAVLPLRDFRELKPTVDAVLAVHPDDLSLKYRMLAFQPTYSGEAARDLIGQETGFGEVHLLIGAEGVPERRSPRRLSRSDPRARAAARQRLDDVRAGEHHICVRAIRRCA